MALATTKATALFFYCLRLNEVPNELIVREFLLIVHRLDFEYKIFISELRTRLRAFYHLITESSYM